MAAGDTIDLTESDDEQVTNDLPPWQSSYCELSWPGPPETGLDICDSAPFYSSVISSSSGGARSSSVGRASASEGSPSVIMLDTPPPPPLTRTPAEYFFYPPRDAHMSSSSSSGISQSLGVRPPPAHSKMSTSAARAAARPYPAAHDIPHQSSSSLTCDEQWLLSASASDCGVLSLTTSTKQSSSLEGSVRSRPSAIDS